MLMLFLGQTRGRPT